MHLSIIAALTLTMSGFSFGETWTVDDDGGADFYEAGQAPRGVPGAGYLAWWW